MGKSKFEANCPDFYFQLPQPSDVLAPCDTELSYMMWMPGFQWSPPLKFEEEFETYVEEDGEQQAHEITDDDLREALEEMVEQDELQAKFNEIAQGGQITTLQASQLARQMGLAPSLKDTEMFEEENGKHMNYPKFQSFCTKCTHPEDNVEDYVSALNLFDLGASGILSSKQIKHIFSTFGEPLNDEEMAFAMKTFCASGTADIKQLAEKSLARE